MILISAVLVLAALGLLIAGITLPQMLLVYVSIGASVLAALLLGVGAFRRRGELLGRDLDASADAEPPTDAWQGAGREGDDQEMEPAGPARSRGDAPPGATATAASPDTKVSSTAPVFVIPARQTYHLASCRQLRTRENTELRYAEARAQGYTACSVCMPDTVLAARGKSAGTRADGGRPGTVGETEPAEGEDDAPAESRESAAGEAGEPRAEPDSARPDPGVRAGAEQQVAETEATDAEVREGNAEPADGYDAFDTGGPAATDAGTTLDTDTDTSAAASTGSPFPAGTGTSGDTDTDTDTDAETSDSQAQAGLVGVVTGSHRYHRLTCAVVEDAVQDGVDLNTMSRDEAEANSCTPCTVCRP